MRRVYATIETRLSDSDLSISDIARAESLSQRYLQRLLKTQETTFTHYLRQRRLERCRIDLMDPNRVGQNIIDIAYNWGFRDGATFSRSFKSAYGLSPTAMRNKLPGALFSIGDPHYAQGDGEICGTALELSLTGDFRLILHKRGQSKKPFFRRPEFSIAGKSTGMDITWLQLFELPSRLGTKRPIRHLFQVICRLGITQCISRNAKIPDGKISIR